MFGGTCQLATIFWGCLGLQFMACVGVCFEEQLVRETIATETQPKPRHNKTHTSNKTHNNLTKVYNPPSFVAGVLGASIVDVDM
jgi:hypothetical protein